MSAAGTTELVKQGEKSLAQKSPINTLRDLLDKMRPQLGMALPKHVDVDRMVRICLTTVQRNPKLLECTRDSLLGCIIQCAQLGLEPDGLLGHAYLIPFNVSRKVAGNWKKFLECTLIVGYKGLLKLARQSGEIASISARVVHAKDIFEYEYGLVEKLVHVPSDEEDPGALTHAYAIFRLKDGSHHFDVMTAREINRIRDNSKGYQFDKDSSPWTTSYDEMAKKTVLRRASKMSPASIEDKTAKAIALDERADAGIPQDLDVGDLQLPAADVPEAEEPGRRISLKHQQANDGRAANTAAIAGESGAASGPPAETGEVTIAATQEALAEIDQLLFNTKVKPDDLIARYPGVASLDKLSAAQATDAIDWLASIDEKGGGAATAATESKPASTAAPAQTPTTAPSGPRFRGGK